MLQEDVKETGITIFYFSGTGNSLKVARDIASGLGDTEVISMVAGQTGEVSAATKRIGLVFPVYMWGLPLIVADFIKRLKAAPDKYIFAVATYGGFPAATLKQAEVLLKKQGLKLSAGFGIRMPGNYTPMYGAISTKKQQKQFKKETEKVGKIVAVVKRMGKAKIEKNFFLLNWIFSGLFYKLSVPQIHQMDKSFWVEESCNGCAICQKICPANNIKLENNKPVWQHNCQQCLACLQWCPKEAIQFGKATKGRKRYHHPEVKVSDFVK